MRIRSRLLVAACAVALTAGPLVFAGAALSTSGSSAFALGPNAVRSGFDANTFAGNDDESYPTSIHLPFKVNFFGTSYQDLYLNNNGNVTFDSALSTYTPFDLYTAGRVIIAAFFADVDTRVGNVVTFGEGTVDGHPAWGANWPGVGCYNENDSVLDNFQLVLIDRSDVAAHDFDIELNYDQIQWDSGQASGGDANCLNGSAARAGYSNGTAENSFELPGSGVNDAFLDSNESTGLVNNSVNSTQLGRYVFSVRNGQPTEPTSLTTSLSGDAQTGTAITVPAGSAVVDSSTLSGANAASASGTVTYTVYSDSSCQTAVADGGTQAVTNGAVNDSNPVTLTDAGTYYWQAVYSGDAANNGSVSDCGSETETVTASTLGVATSASPNPVTAGDDTQALSVISASGGDQHNVTAVVSSDSGSTIVSADPTQGTCDPPTGDTVTCALGDLPDGTGVDIRTVITAPNPAPEGGTFDITTTATSDETPPPGVSDVDTVTVNASGGSQASGYVPPGGTLQLGDGVPNVSEPTVATFTLPNSGPGANMTLDTESSPPNFCGGSVCRGLLLGFNDFPGYTNPKQPAVIRLRYDRSVVLDGLNARFFVQQTDGGPVTKIPYCGPRPHWTHAQVHTSRVFEHLGYGPHSGYASPSPCINTKKIGPGGFLEVTILVLSGDPKIGFK